MCFVGYNDVIMWISAAMAGFFQSSTFPTSVLWASEYIQISGLAAGVFVFGASSAGVVYPMFVGRFFDTGAQMNMVYMILTVAILQIFIFAAMQLFAHSNSKGRSRCIPRDDNKTTEMASLDKI